MKIVGFCPFATTNPSCTPLAKGSGEILRDEALELARSCYASGD